MTFRAADLFSRGGPAGHELSKIDWATNPLGPVEGWPVALRVAVQMMLASAFPKALIWGPSLITLHNEAFRPILGKKPSAQGQPFDVVWAEAWSEISQIADRALSGEATFIENFPLTVERNGYPEACHFTFCYSPVCDEHGNICGFIDTVIETTKTVEAQRVLSVQNAELAHRMKNSLAMLSVIAKQTLRNAPDTTEAWATLSHRINALSHAFTVLAAGGATAAPIAAVVAEALAPHISIPNVIADGLPSFSLNDRQAMSVALAINELATNAIKYGAVAQGGDVSVRWEIDPDTMAFALHWVETGVGEPVPSTRKGFGSQLLEMIVPTDFQGASSVTHSGGTRTYTLTGFLVQD